MRLKHGNIGQTKGKSLKLTFTRQNPGNSSSSSVVSVLQDTKDQRLQPDTQRLMAMSKKSTV